MKYYRVNADDIDFYLLAKLNRQRQHIQSEEDKQDEIATSMRITTKGLLNSAKRLNDIVKDDQKVCLFLLFIFFDLAFLFRVIIYFLFV